MQINKLENQKNINLENNLEIQNKQNNFLESILGKTINSAIDIGIRFILPDFMEEQIINVKDNLLKYGLREGIDRTIKDAINIGKSAIGIFTGNFENISQMQEAIKKGGIIDGISDSLNFVINKATKSGVIDNKVGNVIKNSKNLILNNIENNIEKTFSQQTRSLEYVETYIENWKNSYKEKDFSQMKKEYFNLQNEMKNLVPIEKTLQEARKVEMLHTLIQNKGEKFDLTQEEIQLVEKLK